MIDVTHKFNTLRQAIARAIVKVSRKETIEAVKNKTVPKGDVLECARIAGLFAVKRTSDMIPDCHPMPVEFTQIRYEISDMEIKIEVEVHTVYKTGVEVEAMHGASVVALTIYDMLKPIDKGIEISSIKLQEKKGGKSDFTDKFRKDLKAAVIVCSDTISAGTKEDRLCPESRGNRLRSGQSPGPGHRGLDRRGHSNPGVGRRDLYRREDEGPGRDRPGQGQGRGPGPRRHRRGDPGHRRLARG